MATEPSYTLGTVVGRLEGIQQELRLLREDVNRRLDGQDARLERLERSNSNWRWIERVGVLIGGALTGFFGGRAAGQ